MAILSINSYPAGLVDVNPTILYINTNDTIATVTAAGYLNKAVQQGFVVNEYMKALVATKTSPNATAVAVTWYDVSKVGDDWSLTASNEQLLLPSAQLFVGNASGVAQARDLSGDATISNTGVLTIANNAITTAKILNANVTLAKLAAGITPSHIIKFAGKENNGGGSATIAITVTGALASDIAFAQVQASTNAVSVQKVTPSADTVTVLLSGDPGAATVISYEVLRAAA
jgi:hypothetical protein